MSWLACELQKSVTLLLLFVLGLWSLESIAAESRIWSDKSGKYQIKAKFVDVKDGNVRLERPNGDITSVPLAKLSKDDQLFIRKANKTQKVEKKRDSGLQVGDRVEAKHFRKWEIGTVTSIDYEWETAKVKLDNGRTSMEWPKDMDELRYPGTDRQPVLQKTADPSNSELADKLELTITDTSDMANLLADAPVGGSLTPDPMQRGSGGWNPRAIRLSSPNDFFEQISDFSVSGSDPPLAIVVYEGHSRGRRNEDPARIELVDLVTRKQVVTGAAPPNTKKAILSPAGTKIATIPEVLGANEGTGQIDFWKIDGKNVDHWISFAPYRQYAWPNLDVEWMDWVDEEHVLTTNQEGKTILWQVEKAKAVYELLTGRGSKPILSHGRKQLIVPASDGLQIFEAKTGETLAQVGSGNFQYASLALSPDGKQLAAAKSDFIDIVDLMTGETVKSFPCEGAHQNANLWWIDQDHLFVNNKYIVDVARRFVAWQYDVDSRFVKPSLGTQWALLENRGSGLRVLQPFELPPPEAQSAMSGISEEQLLAVKPGAAISIKVQINDALLRDDVEAALKESLIAAGMEVGEGGPLQLIARMESGERVTLNYRSFSAFDRTNEKIDVTTRVYKLELLQDGVPIWNRTSKQSPPHFLRLQEGESIRAGIARVMKPNSGSFRGRLPSYVVKPEYREPQGTSKLSVAN